MKCEDLLKILNDYIDGDIDESFCTEFQKHLSECDPCRVVVDNIRKTITLYKDDSVFEFPCECHDKLHRMLREKWKQKQGDGED